MNIVVVLTDDQHIKTVDHMPIVQKVLANRGVVFDNAVVSIPECCPFRASFLAGGFYPKNTNVKGNFYPADYFNENDTLAVRLTEAGYATGFIGKYKHGYKPGHTPAGWNYFVANSDGGMLRDWNNLERITYGSSVGEHIETKILNSHNQYLTYFHRDEALKFIRNHQDQPFFLLVSTYAPHVPATPPADETASVDAIVWGEFYESDLTQKPAWVSVMKEKNTRRNYADFARKQILALQPVDRMVGEIDSLLQDLDLSDDTIFIFTSDNGVMIGEHGLPIDKGFPYEPSIRVPLIVRYPGVKPRQDDSLIAVNLDLAATIFDISGMNAPTDGATMLALIREGARRTRDPILIENYGYLTWRKYGVDPHWFGYRTDFWKYIESVDGEKELYNLPTDPKEIRNLADNKNFEDEIQAFSERLSRERGLTFSTFVPPVGKVGQPYRFQLTHIGAVPPYTYSTVRGMLPSGLALDEKTGLISGTPTEPFEGVVMLRVQSGRRATYSRQFEHALWRYKFTIFE